MDKFKSFNLPTVLQASLDRMGFAVPTPIQTKTIPLALQGKDIIGSAQTGTGKTMAFLIPVITKLLGATHNKALILTPTRELATQIQKVIDELLVGMSKISSALLIGGAPIFKQIKKLKSKPRIIIGTPGRVTDHLIRKSLILKDMECLVIDESDRMLDMGFSIQLNEIIKYMPIERQTLMFSATFSPAVIALTKKYLCNPERISIGAINKVASQIQQDNVHTNGVKKYDDLIVELDKREGSIIVFVNTKQVARKLSEKLIKINIVFLYFMAMLSIANVNVLLVISVLKTFVLWLLLMLHRVDLTLLISSILLITTYQDHMKIIFIVLEELHERKV